MYSWLFEPKRWELENRKMKNPHLIAQYKQEKTATKPAKATKPANQTKPAKAAKAAKPATKPVKAVSAASAKN